MQLPVYSSTIRRSEMDAVLTCMVDERVGPGEVNQKLIKLIKDVYGAEGAWALRSPASALIYALKSFNLPEKSGVLLSALAPSWQYKSVEDNGFTPIVLDTDPASALITAQAVEDGVKQGGRVLILHETLGNMPDMAAFSSLPVPVIEDISQSAGAIYNGRQAGLFGDFSILGLEERDILTAGGGAVLFTTNRKNAAVLKNTMNTVFFTDFLPDINAALALIQLKNNEKNIQMRKQMREMYLRSLLQTRHKAVTFSELLENPVYSFPVILESGMKDVEQYTARKEIAVELAFSGSIAEFLNQPDIYIHASSLLLRTILFPLYPRLGAKAEKIAKVLGTLP